MTRLEPRLTPDAAADVLAAARHYESLREGFGAEFLDELENALSLGESQDTVLAVTDLRQDPATIRRAYSR